MPKVPDRIGQVIGQRYELLQVVGRGGQGMVYRANDQWLGRAVAIKVLGSKAAREPHTVERLMREQQAMSALRGTAAVELFDVCRGHQGELCLVMELLSGVDLDEHLYALEERGERLSLSRIAALFDPIVSTLETAHAAGILHRDLKPANIFLLESGEVRLLDFGMARLKKSAPLTAAGTVMGSPSFMAPEAWKGVSDLMDQRADVYSLGVILFRVLAGRLPFEGDTSRTNSFRPPPALARACASFGPTCRLPSTTGSPPRWRSIASSVLGAPALCGTPSSKSAMSSRRAAGAGRCGRPRAVRSSASSAAARRPRRPPSSRGRRRPKSLRSRARRWPRACFASARRRGMSACPRPPWSCAMTSSCASRHRRRASPRRLRPGWSGRSA